MPKILIADDDPIGCKLLKQIVCSGNSDYQFLFAHDGSQVLSLTEKELPDIILLDVIMPGMSGFDVLGQLKGDERFKMIPVILITALEDADNKVKGFSLGAADYIVKPFNGQEVCARIAAHLRIKQDQDELRELNETILRTQKALVESSKMAAVGSLAAGIAHEFNNILFIMSGYLQMYSNSSNIAELQKIGTVFRELVDRGGNIVKGLIEFSRNDEGQVKTPCNIKEILERDLLLLRNQMKDNDVELVTDLDVVPVIDCYRGQMSQVFINVMLNAIDAMASSQTKKLVVRLSLCRNAGQNYCVVDKAQNCCKGRECITVVFSDSGPGLPEEVKDRLFHPFVTTKGVLGGGNVTTPGKGLGLFISYGIVRRHGGYIHVASEHGKGTSFTIVIPTVLGSDMENTQC